MDEAKRLLSRARAFLRGVVDDDTGTPVSGLVRGIGARLKADIEQALGAQ